MQNQSYLSGWMGVLLVSGMESRWARASNLSISTSGSPCHFLLKWKVLYRQYGIIMISASNIIWKLPPKFLFKKIISTKTHKILQSSAALAIDLSAWIGNLLPCTCMNCSGSFLWNNHIMRIQLFLKWVLQYSRRIFVFFPPVCCNPPSLPEAAFPVVALHATS